MSQNNIAFFIDVDNMDMSCEQYFDVIAQLQSMGNILFGKVYGVGGRKHKQIIDDMSSKGFKVERAMRVKRRGRKDFDNRIFVDVVDTVNNSRSVDAVCIIAQPTDFVYLYGYLHAHGIKVIACNNADEVSTSLVDEIIHLAVADSSTSAIKSDKPKTATSTQPNRTVKTAHATERSNTEVGDTAELLKKIENLRNESETASASTSIADKSTAHEQEQPRIFGYSQSDSDLVRKVDESRSVGGEAEVNDLLDQLSKLLKLD